MQSQTAILAVYRHLVVLIEHFKICVNLRIGVESTSGMLPDTINIPDLFRMFLSFIFVSFLLTVISYPNFFQ